MSIVYELKRLIKNKPEYVVSFTQDEMEMIYDALNDYGYQDDDLDDNHNHDEDDIDDNHNHNNHNNG